MRKRVTTAHGRVRAGRVVLAGNVYLGAVAERVADTLVPVTAYTGVTKPLGTRLESVMSYRGAVSDSRYGDYSYRIIDRDRLMWTGGISIRKRNDLQPPSAGDLAQGEQLVVVAAAKLGRTRLIDNLEV